jgi:hypothetical protein
MGEKTVVEEHGKAAIPDERRCTHVLADGRRCRKPRWAGREQCYLHAPEAAGKRELSARAASPMHLLTAKEVHELLSRTMEEVQAGTMTAGRAYAIGYLAQMLLATLKALDKEAEEEGVGLPEFMRLLREAGEGEE